MRAFTYQLPTKIRFGVGAADRAGEAARETGAKKALLLYGGGSAVRSGLTARVEASLAAAGVACVSRGCVRPNPILGFALETVRAFAGAGIDLVLAVGGGSVMDTAKAVAVGLAAGAEAMEDAFRGGKLPGQPLPVGAVVTIAASGSETSPTAVLTDAATHAKLVCSDARLVPAFAVLDPALTCSTPPLQTACGAADILMHTLERYCSDPGGNETTDALAEALLRTVVRCGPACLARPEDCEARSELLWCGSLSHNGLTGLGRDNQFPVHRLGHELAGAYDIPHGMSLTILWPAWAAEVWPQQPHRFARLGRAVFGVTEQDAAAAARAAVRACADWFRSLGLPVCFGQAPMGVVGEDALARFADNCSGGGKTGLGGACRLDPDAILRVYRAANADGLCPI